MATSPKRKCTKTPSSTKLVVNAENNSPNIVDLISGVNLISIASKNYFDNVITEIKDRLLLVEFSAKWCNASKTLAPKLKELADSYDGKILLIKVDVDECEDIALEYKAAVLPTFFFMKNQTKLDQLTSAKIEELKNTLEKFVGEPKNVIDAEIKEGAAEKDESPTKAKGVSTSAAKN